MGDDNVWTVVWKNHSTLSNLSYLSFCKLVDGWSIYPIIINGVIAGGVIYKEQEAHMIVSPAYRGKWFSKKIYRDTIEKQIEQYGCSKTTCFNTSQYKHLIQRLGYKLTHTHNGIEYYECKKSILS